MDLFYQEFIDKQKTERNKIQYRSILNRINGHSPKLDEWTAEDVDQYLAGFESKSITSIQKYLNYLRNISKYYHDKKGLEYQIVKPTRRYKEFLDIDKLRAITITDADYNTIRKELELYFDGEYRNYRDKLIFELAWETLASEELRTLKEDDLEFFDNKIKLNLKDRSLIISDPETVFDIGATIKEMYYYRIQNNGKVLKYPYKDSEFLIKPIAIRKDVSRTDISSMAIIFRQIMRRLSLDICYKSRDTNGTEHNLSFENMSIESVRRSKIIYLLSREYMTIEMVKTMLGKTQQCDITWLNQIAQKTYGKN